MSTASALLTAVAGLCLWTMTARASDSAVRQSSYVYADGSKQIHVDLFEPAAPGFHPSALVLHGAGGMIFDGPEMRRMARELAANGIRAHVVHYFDGSGVLFATSDRVLIEHYNEWLGVVQRAILQVREQQGPPGQHPPVAVYGYSMGAFLALAAASDNDLAAVAEQAGGVWNQREAAIGRMPPVLVVHGRADRRVPYKKFSVPLQRVLKERGGEVETEIVDGQGHGFDAPAQARVRARVAAFFAREFAQPRPTPDHEKQGRRAAASTNH